MWGGAGNGEGRGELFFYSPWFSVSRKSKSIAQQNTPALRANSNSKGEVDASKCGSRLKKENVCSESKGIGYLIGYRVEWLRHYGIQKIMVVFYKTTRQIFSLTLTRRLKRCIWRSLFFRPLLPISPYSPFVSSPPFLPVPRARVRVRRSHAQSSTSRHKISSPLHNGKEERWTSSFCTAGKPFSVLCTQHLSVVLVVKAFHSLSRLACCSVHRSFVFFCRCGMHVPFDFQLEDTNKNFFEFLKVENGNF